MVPQTQSSSYHLPVYFGMVSVLLSLFSTGEYSFPPPVVLWYLPLQNVLPLAPIYIFSHLDTGDLVP
ncbi:hypothetical protein CPB83DRAFT_846477 [Crepidotus variabilis]|uniref:Uncharacterized protein n=1 Tax=Crepidotus variabilis TaxID=179855 RepID=A0A9P6JUG8_9AGAR|nr:hypothetical protein CPB83DRAFT_846477 [Crepidotus variabilis]